MSAFFTITNYQEHDELAFVVGKEVYYTGGVPPPPNKKSRIRALCSPKGLQTSHIQLFRLPPTYNIAQSPQKVKH